MMIDLRDKVTGLLDDSSLDGVKVIQSNSMYPFRIYINNNTSFIF